MEHVLCEMPAAASSSSDELPTRDRTTRDQTVRREEEGGRGGMEVWKGECPPSSPSLPFLHFPRRRTGSRQSPRASQVKADEVAAEARFSLKGFPPKRILKQSEKGAEFPLSSSSPTPSSRRVHYVNEGEKKKETRRDKKRRQTRPSLFSCLSSSRRRHELGGEGGERQEGRTRVPHKSHQSVQGEIKFKS